MAQNTKEFVSIIPYSDYSKGGRALGEALGVHFSRRNRGWLPPLVLEKQRPLVFINWGLAQDPFRGSSVVAPKHVLNPYAKTAKCSNKLTFFDTVKEKVRVPVYTKSFEEAIEWSEQGIVVMGRKVRGSCGKDICWAEDLEEFTNSDFWVQYKKKESEFRVHVVLDQVVAVQKKVVRKTDHEGNEIDTKNVDFRVRNLANGFVFQRNDIQVPEDVRVQALAAVREIGLDFGAVDVIYNRTENKAYVLEINTSPGLEGTTVQDYATPLKERLALLTSAA